MFYNEFRLKWCISRESEKKNHNALFYVANFDVNGFEGEVGNGDGGNGFIFNSELVGERNMD